MFESERNKIVIASDGYSTRLFINGKAYGENITGILFQHTANKKNIGKPEIEIRIDKLPLEGSESLEEFSSYLKGIIESNRMEESE